MPIAAVLNQAQVFWWGGSSIVFVNVSDSGSGFDSVAILDILSLADSGTGTETLNLTINALISDNGAGNDTVQLLIQIPISEIASGTDAVSLLNQLAISDTASANDALAVLKQLAISDTGSGADAITVQNIVLAILNKGQFTLKQFQRYFTIEQVTENRYVLKLNKTKATVRPAFDKAYTVRADDPTSKTLKL